MALRPTNKFISKSSETLETEARSKLSNEKVQAALKTGHSCGTCKHFIKLVVPRCIKYHNKHKHTNHYNICSDHSVKETI